MIYHRDLVDSGGKKINKCHSYYFLSTVNKMQIYTLKYTQETGTRGLMTHCTPRPRPAGSSTLGEFQIFKKKYIGSGQVRIASKNIFFFFNFLCHVFGTREAVVFLSLIYLRGRKKGWKQSGRKLEWTLLFLWLNK